MSTVRNQGAAGKVLSYAEPEGVPELRTEASKYFRQFGLDYSPEEILITNGGSEALLFTFLTIGNPGDEILTPEPLYSIYKEIAKASSLEMKGIMTYAKGRLFPSFGRGNRKTHYAENESAADLNPNNPTCGQGIRPG